MIVINKCFFSKNGINTTKNKGKNISIYFRLFIFPSDNKLIMRRYTNKTVSQTGILVFVMNPYNKAIGSIKASIKKKSKNSPL